MSTRKDIAEIIGYMKLAFPNYSPDVTSPINTVDVLFDLLGDVPTETLRLAVRAACAEAGRAFAPAVGEIREAALKLSISTLGIPNEFEAWSEVCKMPKDMIRSRIEVDEEGKMVTNENGSVIIREEKLKFSHVLVEKTALLMGWPEFPSEDESLDRAHFFQAYRAEVNRLMESEGELPAVRNYVEGRRRDGMLPPSQHSVDATRTIGQVIKTLMIKDAHSVGTGAP
jgi:hypothetical protein